MVRVQWRSNEALVFKVNVISIFVLLQTALVLIFMIENEFQISEQSYLLHLNIAIERFADPLLRLGLFDAKMNKLIFGGIRQIQPVHRYLVELLESSDLNIWEVFRSILPLLNVYGLYAETIEESVKCLSLQRKVKCVNSFLTKQERDHPLYGLPLDTVLIIPIHRILRYRLLLNQCLLKNDGYYANDILECIKACQTYICKLADQMEVRVCKNESVHKLITLHKLLNDQLWTDDQFIIKLAGCILNEGSVYLLKSNQWISKYMYLLSNIIICLSKPLNTCDNKNSAHSIKISFCFDLNLTDIVIVHPSNADSGDVAKISSGHKHVHVTFKSNTDCAKWFEEIKSAINTRRKETSTDDGRITLEKQPSQRRKFLNSYKRQFRSMSASWTLPRSRVQK
ncbi:hypothetical protein GJ496_008249 [Pomphorhynchus laevis]|nr:hypothetical protein GJ496_008249 [Pomphorhynchus laevis]